MKEYDTEVAWEEVKNGFLRNWAILVTLGMIPVLLSLVIGLYLENYVADFKPAQTNGINIANDNEHTAPQNMRMDIAVDTIKEKIEDRYGIDNELLTPEFLGSDEMVGLVSNAVLVLVATYLLVLVSAIALIKAGLRSILNKTVFIVDVIPSVREYFSVLAANITVIGVGAFTYMIIVGLVGPTTDPGNGGVGWGWWTWLLSGLIAMIPLILWFYFTMFTSYFVLCQNEVVESIKQSIMLVKENFRVVVKLSVIGGVIMMVGSWIPVPGLSGVYTPIVVLFYCYFFIKMTGLKKEDYKLTTKKN